VNEVLPLAVASSIVLLTTFTYVVARTRLLEARPRLLLAGLLAVLVLTIAASLTAVWTSSLAMVVAIMVFAAAALLSAADRSRAPSVLTVSLIVAVIALDLLVVLSR
jgi:hypothetical protein